MKPTAIMFVCTGNICRSPMAEFVMKALIQNSPLAGTVKVASAATTKWEINSMPHEGTVKRLAQEGISCEGKRAMVLHAEDYEHYDYIIGMDQMNMIAMKEIFADYPEGKCKKLMSYVGSEADVADPWYTGDFEQTYQDIYQGCNAILAMLIKEGKADT